eukprot:jgi/Tetstr1/421320/TSEL_012291.t1
MIDFACVSSTTPTWSNDPRWCTSGIAATDAEQRKLAANRASSAPMQGVHRYYPFVAEDRDRLGKSALTVVYIFAVLLGRLLGPSKPRQVPQRKRQLPLRVLAEQAQITVEQHVVAAIREHWTVARASYIRVTSKLTWRRYQYLIHALSKRWVEDKGEHEVLLLPYGTPMCLLPSKNEVWEWEDRVAKLAGLEISEDGKRAIIDVMQALRTRLA